MGSDPYSYDIPDDKDMFSKKPTKKDDGDDKQMKFAGFFFYFSKKIIIKKKKFEKGNLKFNNAPKQMDDNSELIEEDLAVHEEELELEDNFNQNANKKVLKTLVF